MRTSMCARSWLSAIAMLCGAAAPAFILKGQPQNATAPPSAAAVLQRHAAFSGHAAAETAVWACEGALEMGLQRYRFQESWDGPRQQQRTIKVTAPNGRSLTVVSSKDVITKVILWSGEVAALGGASPRQGSDVVNLPGISFVWGLSGDPAPEMEVVPSPLGDGAWRIWLSTSAPFFRAFFDFSPEGAMLSSSVFLALETSEGRPGNRPGAFAETITEFSDYREVGRVRIPFLASFRINGAVRSIRRLETCRSGEAQTPLPAGGAQ